MDVRIEMINIDQVVILAGGKGNRLKPLTNHISKCMVNINSIPLLSYHLNYLYSEGFKKFLILTGYKSNKIISNYSKYQNFNIQFSKGQIKFNTGKRIVDAYKLLDSYFLLIYCDNFWPINKKKIIKHYKKINYPIMNTVFSNKKNIGEYGNLNNIKYDNYLVSAYGKKNISNNGVDIGYFIIEKKTLFKFIKTNDNFSLSKDLIPTLIQKKKLGCYITDQEYLYLTKPKDKINFEKKIKKYFKNFKIKK